MTWLSSDSHFGTHVSVLWGPPSHHRHLGDQGNPQPSHGAPISDLTRKGLMNTHHKVWGSLLSSPSPLCLCPPLTAGSRKFPLPSLFLLIATTFSTRVLVLIWFLLQPHRFLLIPLIPYAFHPSRAVGCFVSAGKSKLYSLTPFVWKISSKAGWGEGVSQSVN